MWGGGGAGGYTLFPRVFLLKQGAVWALIYYIHPQLWVLHILYCTLHVKKIYSIISKPSKVPN